MKHMNTCIQCGKAHERKGVYCSKSCTDKAYRLRKKLKIDTLPNSHSKPKVSSKREPIDIPNESGPKLKWCNFCGASLETSPMLQFCNKDHQEDYYRSIKNGSLLKIRIDSRTIIETRKYDRIQELIETMTSRNGYISFFK